MDLLGLRPETSSRIQFFIVKIDKIFKAKTCNTWIYENSFTCWPEDHWHCGMPHGLSSFLLTNKRPRFVSKLFNPLLRLLGAKQLTTTTYHCKGAIKLRDSKKHSVQDSINACMNTSLLENYSCSCKPLHSNDNSINVQEWLHSACCWLLRQ